jgi:hypothetical protein
MPSIKQIQGELAKFDHAARSTETPDAFKALWKRIFNKELSDAAAKSFTQYYKEMRSKSGARKHRKTQSGGRRRRTQRGGAAFSLPSTPVNYGGTVPGLLQNTYGQFPVEVDTDPASIRDLDVYFHDSLPLSRPGYWPTVPADMGSNKVGGSRRRRGHRSRRVRRKQSGGNLLDSLAMRPFPYIAGTPPGPIQSVYNSYSGGTSPVPSPSSPVNHTWSLQGQQGAPINPGQITNISDSFSRATTPPLWSSTN